MPGTHRRTGNPFKQIGDVISPRVPGAVDVNIPLVDKLTFGDGDTYIYEYSDDLLMVRIADSIRCYLSSDGLFGHTGGVATGGLSNLSPTDVIPSLITAYNDKDTGIGRAAADQLSLIAGGVEGLRISESAGVVTLTSPAVFSDCVKIDAGVYGTPSTNPPATEVIGGTQGAKFTVGTDVARYKCPIPANYAGGTMSLQLYWTKSTAGDDSGKTVKWQVKETGLYAGKNIIAVDSTLSVQDTYDYAASGDRWVHQSDSITIPASVAGRAHAFEVMAVTPTGTALSEPVLMYGCLGYSAKVIA